MASFQVEFASSSSSSFGCILRNRHHDHHHCRDTHFVRNHKDHHHVNDNNNIKKKGLKKLHFTTKREQNDSSLLVSPRHLKIRNNQNDDDDGSNSKAKSTPHSPISFDHHDDSPLGASSLVQIWENRLSKSNGKSSSPNTTSSPHGSDDYTTSSFQEWEYWENNNGGACVPPQNSASGLLDESKRVRVADIIKRLPISEQCLSSEVGSPRAVEQGENRKFPCVRGRQAYHALLKQVARDRRVEIDNIARRGPVSKFSHRARGRIQSLIRLKLMQRGAAANDHQCRRSSQPATSEVMKRQPQGSVIMRLRERFSTGVEKGSAIDAREVIDSTRNDNDGIELENNNNVTHLDDHKPIEVMPVCHINGNIGEDDDEKNGEDGVAEASYDEIELLMEEKDDEEEEGEVGIISKAEYGDIVEEIDQKEVETNKYNIYQKKETKYNEVGYDEDGDDIHGASRLDWISEISRPRSYWESRRQEWYREMLQTDESQNQDICQLLQRKPVSSCLSSDFRETMDRLMEFHKGTETSLLMRRNNSNNNNGDEHFDDEEEANNERGTRTKQLVALLQQRMRCTSAPNSAKEDDNEIKEEEEEEKEIVMISGSSSNNNSNNDGDEEIIISEYNNNNENSARAPTFSSFVISREISEEGGNNDFDRATNCRSIPQLPFHQPQCSSSTNPHSMEVELIYNLRDHMKQLYQEMYELKTSIKSCMDMQITLQKSMNQHKNHHTATAKGERKPHDRASERGNCCICNEKADSILYRCGHMCTCLKCANELQWNNGICPICMAPIIDVVRVHIDA